jgi:hypothetical protein
MEDEMQKVGRRELLARGAGVAALAVVGATAITAKAEETLSPTEDAELRELWAKYLDQLGRLREAEATHSAAREPYQTEYDALKSAYLSDTGPRLGDLHRELWKKHRLEPTMARITREHRKLISLTKAVQKAKARTLFGIGVKLSVSEHFEDYDLVEAAEDAQRALSSLTGYDFIAATGPLNRDE